MHKRRRGFPPSSGVLRSVGAGDITAASLVHVAPTDQGEVLPPLRSPWSPICFPYYCTELERRVGWPIHAAMTPRGPIVGLQHDPEGAMLASELTERGLVIAEAILSMRLRLFGAVTVH